MKPSRRDVCRAGVWGAASLGIASACDASRPADPVEGWMIPDGASRSHEYGLSLSHFAPLVGSSFRFVGTGDTAASLQLSAVRDLGIAGRPPVNRAECFSLSFSTRDPSALAQGTYTVSHDTLGSFPLFVVPGSDSRSVTYTALVNRL